MCLLTGMGLGASAAEGPLLLPSGQPPAALAGIPDWPNAHVVALDASGARAAAAFVEQGARDRTRVVVSRPERNDLWEAALAGEVLRLAFDPTREHLYALALRRGKREVRDAALWDLDLEAHHATRAVTLPLSAADLAVLSDGSALLVAVEDQIRSVLLPRPRSGPLVFVPGANLSLAALPGSDRILVGQQERILLLALGDPHDVQGLPARASLLVPAPPRQLVSSPDGRAALALLESGEVWRVDVGEDLRAVPLGEAAWITWLGSARRNPEAPAEEKLASASAPPPRETAPAAVPEPPAPAPPRPPASPPAVLEPSEAQAEAPAPAPSAESEPIARETPTPTAPATQPQEILPRASSPVPPPPAAPAPPEPVPLTAAQVSGRLEGAWSGQLYVVFFGPDNIFREAARVPVARDGSWGVSNLPAGRYRLLVQAEEADAVVVTQPPFVVLDLGAVPATRLPPWHVVRILRPRSSAHTGAPGSARGSAQQYHGSVR